DYTDLFQACDQNALALRNASRAYVNGQTRRAWESPNFIPPRFARNHVEIVELAQALNAQDDSHINDSPRTLIHALDTYERFLIWADTFISAVENNAHPASDPNFAFLTSILNDHRVIFIAAAFLH